MVVQPPWFSGKWQNDFPYYHIHRVNKNSKKALETEYIIYCIYFVIKQSCLYNLFCVCY